MEPLTGILGEYYRELEPAARKKLYAEMEASGELPEEVRRLCELRYTDRTQPGNEVDLFLWHFVNLQQYHDAPGLLRKRTRREILSALERMGLGPGAPSRPEDGPCLYWELRNAARRYFGTLAAPSYGRKLFGVLPAKDDEREARMRGDARKLSRGNAEKYDLSAEMALFCRAVEDEYMAFFHTDTPLS